MAQERSAPPRGPLLVSDFDGTITRNDFYQLIVDRFHSVDIDALWSDYLAKRITHFEVLRAVFASARCGEAEMLALLDQSDIDPRFGPSVRALQEAGWEVVIVSNGCDWYIRRLMARADVVAEVLSNPGRFEEGKGLLMGLPEGSRFLAPGVGIRKAAVVREGLDAGRRVAFAGDGHLDAEAARLVEPGLRFARSNLADLLRREGVPFRPFERWSEVADALLALGD